MKPLAVLAMATAVATFGQVAPAQPAQTQSSPAPSASTSGAYSGLSSAASPAGMATGTRDPRVAGGVPEGQARDTPVTLTLRDAVSRGLARNLAMVSGNQDVRLARASALSVFGGFLPNVNGRVDETIQKINLAAMGLPAFPGIPSVVGPFGVFDARFSVSQNVLNFSLIAQNRAARTFESAARFNFRDVRDQVVVAVVSLYLQALMYSAETASIQAQFTTAEALYRQALDQRNAGVAIGIDVLRAQVEMQDQQQRLIIGRANEEKARLNLVRAIGLPPGQRVTLQPLASDVPQMRTLEDYLQTALQNRSDLKASAELVRAAEHRLHAAYAERLPNVTVDGNYGALGRSPGSSVPTYAIVGALNIPIFPGTRIRVDVERAQAELAQRRAEHADTQARVDNEVRSAFLDLQAAIDRLKVAEQNSRLAADELTQARDRFAAGVTNNLEVVQAQQSVAAADEALIVSRYTLELARLATARAAGNAEDAVRDTTGAAAPKPNAPATSTSKEQNP